VPVFNPTSAPSVAENAQHCVTSIRPCCLADPRPGRSDRSDGERDAADPDPGQKPFFIYFAPGATHAPQKRKSSSPHGDKRGTTYPWNKAAPRAVCLAISYQDEGQKNFDANQLWEVSILTIRRRFPCPLCAKSGHQPALFDHSSAMHRTPGGTGIAAPHCFRSNRFGLAVRRGWTHSVGSSS
jgi:hypothetical protein